MGQFMHPQQNAALVYNGDSPQRLQQQGGFASRYGYRANGQPW